MMNMGMIKEGAHAAFRDDNPLKLIVYGLAAGLVVALGIGVFFQAEEHGGPWTQWHAIQAHYEPAAHAIVIDSRSWTMREPCPAHEPLARNAFVIDEKRALHIFETAIEAPVFNEVGSYTSAKRIEIPLVDANGTRLDIVPVRMRLAVTCGTRAPAVSAEIDLAAPQEWWR